MPIIIGLASGLFGGLGISLISKGNLILGAGWFFIGLAVAWVLYMRMRDNEKSAVKAEIRRDENSKR